MQTNEAIAYWRANRNLIFILLAIWALVSFVFAILLARPLEGISVGSLPMSFWWAQQGSMFVFVILIFVYAWRMDALDEKFDVHEEDDARAIRRAKARNMTAGEPPVGRTGEPGDEEKRS